METGGRKTLNIDGTAFPGRIYRFISKWLWAAGLATETIGARETAHTMRHEGAWQQDLRRNEWPVVQEEGPSPSQIAA